MNKVGKFEAIINFVMAALLTCMGLFVFTNVVLRYFFNSGLTWAEEMSRFLFIWLIFLGGIGALKDNNHLGFTSLVQKLSPTLKKLCFIVSNILVLICLAVLFVGSVEMTTMSTNTVAPATGMPLSYMYAIGIIASVGMFIVVCLNSYKALFVKGAIDQLVVLKESEEEIGLENNIDGGAK